MASELERLRHDVDKLDDLVGDLRLLGPELRRVGDAVGAVRDRVDRMENRMDKRFDQVEKQQVSEDTPVSIIVKMALAIVPLLVAFLYVFGQLQAAG